MNQTEASQVMDELGAIRAELRYIRDHMVDVDCLLTAEEEARLEESLQEYREGKGVSLEDFEREMAR